MQKDDGEGRNSGRVWASLFRIRNSELSEARYVTWMGSPPMDYYISDQCAPFLSIFFKVYRLQRTEACPPLVLVYIYICYNKSIVSPSRPNHDNRQSYHACFLFWIPADLLTLKWNCRYLHRANVLPFICGFPHIEDYPTTKYTGETSCEGCKNLHVCDLWCILHGHYCGNKAAKYHLRLSQRTWWGIPYMSPSF